MSLLASIPLLSIHLVIFNLMLLVNGAETAAVLSSLMFSGTLFSGAVFTLTIGDFLVILGVILLYFELLKSTRFSTASTVEHMVSMLVFIIFLIEFITVKGLGNASFLVITLLSLIDVLSGFTVSISTARRDIDISA